MFLVLVPAGLGGCYFRLNQLPAGSLDEIPPHRDQEEVAPSEASTGDLWPQNPNCSEVPRDLNLLQDGSPISLRNTLLEKRHLLPTLQGKVQHNILRKQLHSSCEGSNTVFTQS